MNDTVNKQRGFAAILAVMLIVGFALIGTFMLTTVGSQNMTTALSQREMQAWFAAQSGIDWAINQVVRDSSGCPPNCNAGTACLATVDPATLTPGSYANGFSVEMDCSCTCVNEGALGRYAMYNITATATQGNAADPDYVSRTAQALVKE